VLRPRGSSCITSGSAGRSASFAPGNIPGLGAASALATTNATRKIVAITRILTTGVSPGRFPDYCTLTPINRIEKREGNVYRTLVLFVLEADVSQTYEEYHHLAKAASLILSALRETVEL